MDKMGNDTDGIVVVMVTLAVLVFIVWLGGLLAKYIRRRMQNSN
jgi:hypothetical protein